MKKYLLAILIILFIIGAAYFIFRFYSGTKSAPASSAPEQANMVTWTVEYEENIFIPKELKIKKGDTVIWVNNHSEPVWPASAFHPTHQVYRGFDAFNGIKTGESFSFTFDKVGSWNYHNHLSPGVTGVVEVE